MNETVNQEKIIEAPAEERTFTQAEVDAIVGDRLKRERGKYADYDALKEKAQRFDEIKEASKTELQKATEKVAALQTELDGIKKANELREMRERVANEKGVPVTLLTADDEESAKKQAEDILAFARPTYPSVKDAGEVRTPGKLSTKQQFAKFMNEALG